MPSLTLTFDNGPVPGATDRVLDVLKDRQLPAVFFAVGEKLATEAGQALAERCRREGHLIGNHTMHHARPLGEYDDPQQSVAEISRTQALLDRIDGSVRLFRPPGRGRVGPHLLSTAALEYLVANAFTVVTWNAVPGDWLEPKRDWFEKALRQVDSNEWSVLVLHDHCQVEMLDLLEAFLDRVQADGYEFRRDFPASCLPVVRGQLMVDPAAIST